MAASQAMPQGDDAPTSDSTRIFAAMIENRAREVSFSMIHVVFGFIDASY